MQKKLYYISLLILILINTSCKTEKKNEKLNSNTEVKIEHDNLNGTWVMTSYFDSIIKNKLISKYTITPTWHALIIEISNDSIYNYGSILSDSHKINFNSDTLAILSGVSGNWILQKNKNELRLNNIPNEYLTDTTSYILEKRNDLRFLIKNNTRDQLDFWNATTEYFNEKLISGKYTYKNDTVIFGKKRRLWNFKDFEGYRVINYFGTSHPFNPHDAIFLINKKELKPYNWKFENNKLILTNFIPKKEIHNGKEYITNNHILGNEKIELIKIE